MDVRIRSTFFRLAKAKCFGPLFHLCLSRTLWIAFSPILSHYLCTNFPNGDTDKVNGCILVIFRRAKVASGPQMRDSLRLRHRRSPTSQSSRGTRPKRGTPWAPSPPTSLSRHHSPSFSPEDNCKNLLVPEMDGSGTIPTPYPLSLA